MRPVSRVAPVGPTDAYKTYQIVVPLRTHFRQATCAEVNCPNYLNGWRSIVPPETADAIRAQKGKLHFTERPAEGGLVEFEFPAGQTCFRWNKHRVRLARPELYFVRDGDWRGNPTGRRYQHVRGEEWVEDFAEHQDRLARQIEKG